MKERKICVTIKEIKEAMSVLTRYADEIHEWIVRNPDEAFSRKHSAMKTFDELYSVSNHFDIDLADSVVDEYLDISEEEEV